MATATESGYGAFLPQGRNERVQREILRGQMVKQAAYLSSMDQVYAQLEEEARQFDVSLQEKIREFDESMSLEWAKQDWAEEYGTRSLGLQEKLGMGQLDIAQGKLGLGQEQLALQREEFEYGQRVYEQSVSDLMSARETRTEEPPSYEEVQVYPEAQSMLPSSSSGTKITYQEAGESDLERLWNEYESFSEGSWA